MPQQTWTPERDRRYERARPTNLRSHESDGGPTYDDLYEEARKRNLKGRSKMSKTELERALGR
jgi:hypothetical protein